MRVKAEIIDQANLTPRECQILALICEGDVDKAIAKKLAISIKTVNAHIEHLYLKLDVREADINVRCAAISQSVVRGLVKLSSTLLCLWLMVASVSLDNQAIRVSRLQTGRMISTRLKRGNDA